MPNEAKDEVKEQYVTPTLLILSPLDLCTSASASQHEFPNVEPLSHLSTHRFESSAKEAKPESDKFGVGGTA